MDIIPLNGPTVGNAGGNGPQKTAEFGITTGLVLDCIGSILYIVGEVFSSDDLATSIQLSVAGSWCPSAGGVVGNICYAVRMDAYYQAGYDVSSVPSLLSWALCIGSVACTAGGTLLGVTEGAEDFDAALAAYVIVVVGGLVECINVIIRTSDWERALTEAPRRAAKASCRLRPIVRPYPSSSGVALAPGMALAVEF